MNKAILVGLNDGSYNNFEYSMEELKNLALGLNIEVCGMIIQNNHKINPAFYIGKGKVTEIFDLKEKNDADLVIFNDELSPSQIRNLEEELKCTVKDRSNLILDIFVIRARTKEAQCQVEIAKLQYELPRLVGLNDNLGRQRSGGVTMRGPGETKLEYERRRIEGQVKALKKELEFYVATRMTKRKLRQKNEIPVVSLVGYTNAGKSTLMNAFVSEEKAVFEKDMLFATLDTQVREVRLQGNKIFLLTDTVGFISKLPHHLVNAFRSTLEELSESDLLIHVIDCSNPHYQEQVETTMNTLTELGINTIPMIKVYNKADLVMDRKEVDGIYCSARTHSGVDQLISYINNELFKDIIISDLFVPFEKIKLVHTIYEKTAVVSSCYKDDGVVLTIKCERNEKERLARLIMEI